MTIRALTTGALVLAMSVAHVAPTSAQATSKSATAPASAAPSAATPAATPTAEAAGDPSAAPAPQGYTYNPDDRRDPFVSLVRRGSDAKSSAGTRPAGLAGLETSEVTLKGTMDGRKGFVGIVQGVDNKTYIVRPGDKLLDGTIKTIAADVMVILQQETDPLSPRKQREVRKALRHTEGAR